MKRSLISLAVGCALLGGCSLIPEYQRPQAPVAEQWPGGLAEGAESTRSVSGWREFFRQPQLQQLIEVALENNRDLRVAALNVEAYRAQQRIQHAALYPDLGVAGSGSRQRVPGDLGAGSAVINSQYSLGLSSSWELDLFGRLRSLDEAALQQYFATAEAQRATQLALVAGVASAWLNLQADQQLLELTASTLQTYRESLALTERSVEVGVADALTLSQTRGQVHSAEASLARYQRQVQQDRNALVVLLGGGQAELSADAGLSDDLLQPLPAGLPADLLQRRPDVLQAEHLLKAANANIGAARAAFFPSISLTASAGTASRELSGLFDAGSGTWLFQPQINLPIFTAGRLKASLDYSRLQKDINIASYEKAIQLAFQEVADGLAARSTYGTQLDAQRELVATSEQYLQLAERRYQSGVDSYLTLLDAQRQLFAARQQLIGDRLAQLTSEVALYQALGGGWQERVGD